VDTKPQRLTDAIVRRLPTPPKSNRIHYDPDVGGFGVRVTAAGSRSFVLTYWVRGGRQRRFTIGGFPDWQTTAARAEARRLKQLIDGGGDPLAELEAERGAPTVNDLIRRFLEEHVSRKRPSTQADYRIAIERHIRPAIGNKKLAEVTWADGDALHRKLTKAGKPTQANRIAAVMSKMFALAIKWRLRLDNPAKGIERNPETKRKRYATPAELKRLMPALDRHPDQQGADIFRFLLLTGSRSHEAMGARWDAIDLDAGIWTKPGATTKQKTDHVAPLSAPAKQLLAKLRRQTNSEWVFPAPDSSTGHRVTIAKSWRLLCKAARISGLRVHDLRHSFASQLVSQGASLPLIGALLGHTQAQTTARYAHLFDDPQRAAVERVGAVISNAGKLTKAVS
jgi:integrase